MLPRGRVSFSTACALIVATVVAGVGAWMPPGTAVQVAAGAGGLVSLALAAVALVCVGQRDPGGPERSAARSASADRLERTAWALGLAGLALARGALGAERARPPDLGAAFRDERSGWLEGTVAEAPGAAGRGFRFPLAVKSSTLGLPGGARVSLWCEPVGVPRAGARVALHAALSAPRACNTPGGFDEAAWLAARGASLSGRVTGASCRELTPPPPSLDAFLGALRRRWSTRLAARVPGEAGEFLRGLLLGERGRVSPEAIDDLRRAGALHLLALSGQHVVLVAALLAALPRLAGAGTLTEGGVALTGVWLYSLLTGSSPSVVRAALALTLTGAARMLGRTADGVRVLVWSTAIAVCASPPLALDSGFQLSCLASAGLVVAGRLQGALPRPGPIPRFLAAPAALVGAALAAVLATAGAQLAVLPLLAARFGAVSVVGLASNLVLVPVCAVLLSAGLPLLVLDTLVPTPAVLWRVLAALAAFLLEAGSRCARWPMAWVPCSLSGPVAAAALAAAAVSGLAALAAGAARRAGAPPLRRAAALAICALFAAAWATLVALGFVPRRERPRATLSYWLLDVGQGDAQVLEFADGRVLAVDFGDLREGFDAGARVVAPFARARGIRKIDEAVITHEDRDHAGGWPAVARDVRVRELATGCEALAALAVGDRGDRGRARDGPRLRAVAAGDTLLAGPGYAVRVLWPPPGVTGWPSNRRCVVIEVVAGGDRLVLAADADSTTEPGWLPEVSGPVTALKLGHHGARACTGSLLLGALRPRLALVSCGRGNRFGHPHAETLARLAARGIAVARTDRDGTVRLDLGRRLTPPP